MSILDDLQNSAKRIIEAETTRYVSTRIEDNKTPEAPQVLPPSVSNSIAESIKSSPVPYIIGGVALLGVAIWALRAKAA